MNKNLRRHYETTFIVDSLLEDQRVESIVNKYTSFLKKNGCEDIKTEIWGRRKFAYPIKKRQSGNYVSIEFTAEPSVIAKLERAYHLDDDVLRYLNVYYDKKTLEERKVYLVKKEQIMKEREAAAQLLEEQSAEADTEAEASETN